MHPPTKKWQDWWHIFGFVPTCRRCNGYWPNDVNLSLELARGLGSTRIEKMIIDKAYPKWFWDLIGTAGYPNSLQDWHKLYEFGKVLGRIRLERSQATA